MKLGLSDLKTERQCRAAIGMDKDRFFKLLGSVDISGIVIQKQPVIDI